MCVCVRACVCVWSVYESGKTNRDNMGVDPVDGSPGK